MAFALVSGQKAIASGTSTATATLPNQPAQGNTIIVTVGQPVIAASLIPTVADGNSNALTRLVGAVRSATTNATAIYGWIAGAAQSKSFTVTGTTGNTVYINVYEFSGGFAATNGTASTFIDNAQTATVNGSGTTGGGAATGLTTTNPNDMIVAALNQGTAPTTTLTSSGVTILQANPSSPGALLVDGNVIETSTVSGFTASFSWNASHSFQYAIVALLPAPPPAYISTYYDVVKADAPVSWWRMDATSGTNQQDTQGLHNGTYHATPTLNVQGALSADPNAAVTFASASSQYMSAGTIQVSAANFTMEAWVKFTTAQINAYMVDEASTASNNPIAAFNLDSTGGTLPQFFVRDGTGLGETAAAVNAANDGNWHHLVGTCTFGTPTVINLWIDGINVAIANANNTAALATNTFSIGGLNRAAITNFFSGSIDEVAIYNKVLTAARIRTHYYVGRSTNFLPFV